MEMNMNFTCREKIIASNGATLFRKGKEYKGRILDSKGTVQIKDDFGAIQTFPPDSLKNRWFKNHFKLIEKE